MGLQSSCVPVLTLNPPNLRPNSTNAAVSSLSRSFEPAVATGAGARPSETMRQIDYDPRRDKPLPPVLQESEPVTPSEEQTRSQSRLGIENARQWLEPPFVTPSPGLENHSASASASSASESSPGSPLPGRPASRTVLRSAFASGGKYLRNSALWSQTTSRSGGSGKASNRSPTTLSPHTLSTAAFGRAAGRSPAGSEYNLDRMSDAEESVKSRDLHMPSRSQSPSLLKRLSKTSLKEAVSGASVLDDSCRATSSTGYFSLRRGTRQLQSGKEPAGSSSTGERRPASEVVRETTTNPTGFPQTQVRTLGSKRPASINSKTISLARSQRHIGEPVSAQDSSSQLTLKRPPLLRRDRSKSVGDVELLLRPVTSPDPDAEVEQLTDGDAAPSASQRTLQIQRREEDSLADTQDDRSFLLPRIETSSHPFMDASETSLRARGSTSRWSRMLGKRGGSISGKYFSHDAEVANAAQAGTNGAAGRTTEVGMARAEPYVKGSKRSTKVATTLRGVKSSSSLASQPEAASSSSVGQSRPAPAPDNSNPILRRPPSRKSIIESSRLYGPPDHHPGVLPAIGQPLPGEQKELLQVQGAPQSQPSDNLESSPSSPATPLSPNLASLWSSAVDMDSDEEMSSPGIAFHDVPTSPAIVEGVTPSNDKSIGGPTSLASASTKHSLQRSHPQTSRPTTGMNVMSRTDAAPKSPQKASSHSRKSSLGRTLATVFDPRPSVEPYLQGQAPNSTAPPATEMPSRPSTSFGMASRRGPSNATQRSRKSSLATLSSASTSTVTSPVTAKSHQSNSSTPTKLVKKPVRSDVPRSTSAAANVKVSLSPHISTSSSVPSTLGRQEPSLTARAPPGPVIKKRVASSPMAKTPSGSKPSETRSRVVSGQPGGAKTTALLSPHGKVQSNNVATSERNAPPSHGNTGKALPERQQRASDETSEILPPPTAPLRSRKKSLPSFPTILVNKSPVAKQIPPRSSSQAAVRAARTARSEASAAIRKLSPASYKKTASTTTNMEAQHQDSGSMPIQRMPRPSSSLGLYGLEKDTTLMKKLHQQEARELDDTEFLQLLEEARRQHQEKAAKEAEAADRMVRMAQLGMATGKKTSRPAFSTLPENDGVSSANPQAQTVSKVANLARGRTTSASRIPVRERRHSSADGRLSSSRSSRSGQQLQRESCESIPAAEANKLVASSSTGPALGTSSLLSAAILPSNVGYASGQPQPDGVFSSDDDWKREVRALFVIRELLSTEQSYARHLESLLHAVRRKAISPSNGGGATSPPLTGRRKSVSGFTSMTSSSSGGSQNKSADRHLPLMRNLLPQLIALSRSLSARIDANPTAAGVGSAFSVVAPQLEATFVAWSSVANEIMASLRQTQGPKGKARDKLTLLAPLADGTDIVAPSGPSHRFSSQPASPVKPRQKDMSLEALALTRPSSPSSSECIDADGDSTLVEAGSTISPTQSRLSKRRSTISSVRPRSLKAFSSQMTAVSPVEPNVPASPPRPTSPWGFASTRRSFAAAASKKLSASSSSLDLSSLGGPTGNSASGARTPAPGPANGHHGGASKALSPLDVAIMPMQRPPRYLLLLAELVRNTTESSLSHVRVSRSLDMMKAIAMKCDEASGKGAAARPLPALPSDHGGQRDGSQRYPTSRSTTPSLPSRASTILAMTVR